jgi:predicted secreted protein
MTKLTKYICLLALLTLVLAACSVEAPAVSGQAVGETQNPGFVSGDQSDGDEVNLLEVPDKEDNVIDEVNDKGILVVSPGIYGVTAKVKVGDIVEVRIPTIPTEGFQWMPEMLDTSLLEQQGEAVYAADASANAAGGIVSLQFKALAPGTVNVTLVYTNAASGKDPAFTKNTFGFELIIE